MQHLEHNPMANKVSYDIIIQKGDGVRHNRLDRLMTPTSVQNSPYSCH